MRMTIFALLLILSRGAVADDAYVPEPAVMRFSVDLVSAPPPIGTTGCGLTSFFAIMELGPSSPVSVAVLLAANNSHKKEAAAGMFVQLEQVHEGERKPPKEIRVRAFRIQSEGAHLIVRRAKKKKDIGGMYGSMIEFGDVARMLTAFRDGNEVTIEFEGGPEDFPSRFKFVPDIRHVDASFLRACTEALAR